VSVFPQRLREVRAAAGLKQTDVADRLGVSSVTVSRWERGAMTPPLSRVHEIADALGVAVGELVTGDAA
jgi:transcriptional regulator with XRE-family HTH domain